MTKKKLLRNLALILMSLALILLLADTPRFLPLVWFRAVERGNLVGPSEILAVEPIEYRYYNGMIIAETKEGVILWIYGKESKQNHFCYRERYSDPLLMSIPSPSVMVSGLDKGPVPLVLFDSLPKAARAEIRFTLEVNLNGKNFKKDYALYADRSSSGYFLFTMDVCALTEDWSTEAERAAVRQFCLYSTNQNQNPTYFVPVDIRFYDLTGQLIETNTVYVRSGAAIYVEENEVTP